MNNQDEERNGSNTRTLSIAHNEPMSSLSKVNLLDENEVAKAEVFLKKYITSKKGGIESIADGLAIIQRAQDLQLPFSTCVEHVHVINGKTGIDIHIIKSLLSRAGVVWECTKDYTPQYQYTDGNTIYNETQLPSYCVICRTAKEAEEKTSDETIGVYPLKWYADLKGNIYNEFQVSDKCVVALNKAHAQKLVSEGKFPILRIASQPTDYVTEYKFTRYKIINGKERIITCISHFSFSEATTAGLFTKDTYQKYARIFIGHRAFTYGARDIAGDLLMGCMETTELKLATKTELDEADYAEVVG